jgi:hypothetical protein
LRGERDLKRGCTLLESNLYCMRNTLFPSCTECAPDMYSKCTYLYYRSEMWWRPRHVACVNKKCSALFLYTWCPKGGPFGNPDGYAIGACPLGATNCQTPDPLKLAQTPSARRRWTLFKHNGGTARPVKPNLTPAVRIEHKSGSQKNYEVLNV